ARCGFWIIRCLGSVDLGSSPRSALSRADSSTADMKLSTHGVATRKNERPESWQLIAEFIAPAL
ncbi:hypothetical protein NL317_28200, partial [Klebsiella pneumoniae]|nr:hypothetical protein [Klebsiella pneumoniae]